MKKRLIICVAVILIITLLSSCGNLFNNLTSRTPEPTQQETYSTTETPEPDTSASTDVLVETDTYAYVSEFIEVNIEVPKLSGMQDGAAVAAMNTVFSAYSAAIQAEIVALEDENRQLIEENITSAAPYVIDVSYSVPYYHNGIISITIMEYRYQGAAHGGTTKYGYTFDLTTGEKLGVKDLMKDSSDYKTFINSAIRSEIDRRALIDGTVEIAPFEDIGAEPAYYLTEDAIVFYFQEYEYFPYAAGIQEFPILYSDLIDLLSATYAALGYEAVELEQGADTILAIGDTARVTLEGNPTTGYTWQYILVIVVFSR